MADKVVVVGLGQFGAALAHSLASLGYDVLAVERRSDRVKEFAEDGVRVVQADATSKGVWDDLRLSDYKVGIVAFGTTVEGNILTALLLKKIGIPYVIAKSTGEFHTEVLQAIGVDQVVQPQQDSGRRLAHVVGANITDYLEVAKDYGVALIQATLLMADKTCSEIEKRYEVTVLLIRREQKVIVSPSGTEPVKAGDALVVAGKDIVLRRLGSQNSDA